MYGGEKMYRLAICDDELCYREQISVLLSSFMEQNYRGLYHFDTYDSGKAICVAIENGIQYDAIFLDIHMPDMNGMESANIIKNTAPDTIIVLVTACKDYVLEGYKVGAFRYLLKSELEEVFPECVNGILQKLEKRNGTKFHFVEGNISLNVQDVIYVESSKHRVIFYTKLSEMPLLHMYEKLDVVEERLLSKKFIRVHKSYLVNAKEIETISNYKVVLKNGVQLPIPRDKYKTVKQQLQAIYIEG